MDEKLTTTIQRIRLLAEQNPEFKQEMQKMFSQTSSVSSVSVPNSISENISEIRAALEIRGNHSIDYDFIKEKRLREQLYIDNFRMENAALNLQEKDIDRFYIFCVNAFYQVENLVNYYFHTLYPDINDLLTVIEEATKNIGGKEEYQFNRSKGKFDSVGDIQVFYKINAMCNILFSEDIPVKVTLGNLRKVRNEGEHRCQVIWTEKNEADKLYVFFKKTNFSSIRNVLRKVVSEIKKQLQPDNDKEYKSTILSLISRIEDIKKAYDDGEIDKCKNLIDVGESIIASLNVDDENAQLIQSQLERWNKIISDNQ